jgi:hypothetical protein
MTPKQEKFCAVYVAIGNATEAYRQTYDTARMKPQTVNRKAKELVDNGKVAARLAELRAPVAEAARGTSSRSTASDLAATPALPAGSRTASWPKMCSNCFNRRTKLRGSRAKASTLSSISWRSE